MDRAQPANLAQRNVHQGLAVIPARDVINRAGLLAMTATPALAGTFAMDLAQPANPEKIVVLHVLQPNALPAPAATLAPVALNLTEPPAMMGIPVR